MTLGNLTEKCFVIPSWTWGCCSLSPEQETSFKNTAYTDKNDLVTSQNKFPQRLPSTSVRAIWILPY